MPTATVEALNKAREDAIKAGGDPYAGNLKDLTTYTGANPGLDTPAPGAPGTTIEDAYKGLKIGAAPEGDAVLAGAMAAAGKTATGKVPTEKEIYRQKLKMYQAEIDATNQIYAGILEKTKTQGLGDLGSGRAIQARSGLLGSDFGAAQTSKINDANRAAENLVLQEQNQKINSILGMARKDAVDELAKKREAQRQGTKDYLEYLASASERKVSKLAGIAAAVLDQGLTLDQIDPKQLAEIAKNYGVTVDDISQSIISEKKTRDAAQAEADAKARKDNSFQLGEGEAFYEYDPATGEYKQVASRAKTYAPKDGPGSTGLPGDMTSSLRTQPGYGSLTAAQKKQADSLNNLVRTLKQYRTAFEENVNGAGTDLVGASSALLETKLNSIIFAAAQAEGTGALQQADREVIEKIIPNPTTLGGAWNALTKGGKQGSIGKIDDQILKYTQNLGTYGLSPVLEDVAAPPTGGAAGAYEPGETVLVDGVPYTVGEDGDSLIPQ